MTILIVDDNASQRLLSTTILRGAGYTELITASSAREAFERLKLDGEVLRGIDLILLDISMPDMDGIEACRCIKAHQEFYDTPIIMVTASTEVQDLKAAFEAGAMDYITKPPNKVEMLARVRSAVKLKHEIDARQQREQQLLDYVEQAGHVTAAAVAVEAQNFNPESLSGVASRTDELGQLARVFTRMACEVIAREERLKKQIVDLHIEIDRAKEAQEVAEITETDYFRELSEKARKLRNGDKKNS